MLTPKITLKGRTSGGTEIQAPIANDEASFINGVVIGGPTPSNAPIEEKPFELPGRRIEIKPIGLILYGTWMLLGVSIVMFGRFTQILLTSRSQTLICELQVHLNVVNSETHTVAVLQKLHLGQSAYNLCSRTHSPSMDSTTPFSRKPHPSLSILRPTSWCQCYAVGQYGVKSVFISRVLALTLNIISANHNRAAHNPTLSCVI